MPSLAKFTNKPKAKVPWGLLIQSPLDYLDSGCIPDGFIVRDPSKWTKADIIRLGTHWRSLEAKGKAIITFIGARKDDLPLEKPTKIRTAGSKKPWMDIEDSEEDEPIPFSDSEEETNKVSGKPKKKSAQAENPHEDSPCAHSHQDQIQFLRSLSIMPQYQDLIDIVHTLSKVVSGIIVILCLLMVNIFIGI